MTSARDHDDSDWLRPGLDLGGHYRLEERLDARAPGNWALVGRARGPAGAASVALKIMRERHLDSANVYEMFGHEAGALARFGGSASATPLVGSGFVRAPPAGGGSAPADLAADAAAFARELPARQAAGWRPFLVLALVPFDQTLLALLRTLSQSADDPVRNMALPLWEALAITRQALDLLAAIHAEGLYYLDHKPEHVTWDGRQVRFLDWNGGEWLPKGAGRHTRQAKEQLDVLNFVGYVAYPLFTGRQLDGSRVRAIQRGTPHPPPVTPADDERLPFYEASGWLEPELQTILSRPFWSTEARFPDAAAMVTALQEYEQGWRQAARGLDRRLELVVGGVRRAQVDLSSAQREMERLLGGRWFAGSPAQRAAACREAQRLAEHVQRFYNLRVLPNEGAGEAAGPVGQSSPLDAATNGHAPAAEVALPGVTPAAAPGLNGAAAPAATPTPAAARSVSATPVTVPLPVPPELLALYQQLEHWNRDTIRATLDQLASAAIGRWQAAPDDPVWRGACTLFAVASVFGAEIARALGQANLSTPGERFSARISLLLRKHLRAALVAPETTPPQIPAATLRWATAATFLPTPAADAAREAFRLVIDLYLQGAALQPRTYAGALVALRDAQRGPLARLRTLVPPLDGVAAAVLDSALEIAFAAIQEALEAKNSLLAHAWFSAVTA